MEDEGQTHGIHDGDILIRLRKMTKGELNQALIFGDVTKWHNERLNRITAAGEG